ncbi:MAG: hypothetical protein GXY54_01175 [Deltaproteobacteria bacterium]|nr:hypothetical protein [Deltaproteobacteria bacterium]
MTLPALYRGDAMRAMATHRLKETDIPENQPCRPAVMNRLSGVDRFRFLPAAGFQLATR